MSLAHRKQLGVVGGLSTAKRGEEDEDEDLSLRFAPAALKPARRAPSSVSSTGSNNSNGDSKPPAVSFALRNRSPSPAVNFTESDLIEGRWQLMFTTRPGTASPIQRTFTGVDVFTVFQDVYLKTTKDPRVSNIVKFSDFVGELKVEAVASIKDAKRVLFRFDRAAFALKFLPFKVPYPVPLRLLGDEAKGWLDTTYLSPSGNLRISRENKGTTFVLQKETVPRQKLLATISQDKGVAEAINEFLASSLETTGLSVH
ncbi:hypothetical protein Bca4012_063904 [Brassica carinata]